MRNKFAVLLMLGIVVVASMAEQASGASSSTQSPLVKNYAIINLKCGAGVTEPDGELISDRLRAEIFNTGNVNVMERNQMQDILKEQGFQQSGVTCTDEECLVKMGQMLGVHYLVAGSLGKLGSMYMVNMRTIDVQTGKIVRAVSVDVKGDIEDLVEYLPRIALQLTTDSKKQNPVVIVNTQESIPHNAKDTATPTVEAKQADTTQTVQEPVVEAKSTEEQPKASKSGRNKNRSGIGLMFDLYGKANLMLDDKVADTLFLYNFLNIDSTYYYFELKRYKAEYVPIKTLGVRFIIRAGQVMTVDIGPSLTYGSQSYTLDTLLYSTTNSAYFTYTGKLAINYTVPAVHVGLNFVKRWFPMKMNLGAYANVSMPITTFSFDRTWVYPGYSYLNESENDEGSDLDFKIAFGTRTGVEIQAGPHVGFSFDFVFDWLQWDTKLVCGSLGTASIQDERTVTVVMPLFGFGLGVNFYY